MKELKGECMLWAKACNTYGYGTTSVCINGKQKKLLAHRALYESVYGEIPKGIHLDHLCRVTNCINLDHLEPVTNRENVLRGKSGVLKTHCKHGHEYTAENTMKRISSCGYEIRLCRQCKYKWSRAWYHSSDRSYKGRSIKAKE